MPDGMYPSQPRCEFSRTEILQCGDGYDDAKGEYPALFGMYPSRPKRECLGLSFFDTVLAMAVGMAMVILGECTRICFG